MTLSGAYSKARKRQRASTRASEVAAAEYADASREERVTTTVIWLLALAFVLSCTALPALYAAYH